MDVGYFPKELGQSMYIRPWAMSTSKTLGIQPPSDYGIFIALNPVANYFGAEVKPINIAVERGFERGNPKTAAGYKLSANYAATIQPMRTYNRLGYHQMLWTYDDTVSEVGACNIMFVIENSNGEKELITPELDGSILPGIIRRTILEFMREHVSKEGSDSFFKLGDGGKAMVDRIVERKVTLTELKQAFEDGKIYEAFGCGTAVLVAPVNKLFIDGKDYYLPIDEDNIGDVTKYCYKQITEIQHGIKQSDLMYIVE